MINADVTNHTAEFELIAKTFQGLEEVLAEELTSLGANNVQIGRRMVSFTGDKAMMYRANFCLRTAIRILKPIRHFKAKDADDVYNEVRKINWNNYLDVHTSFAVDSVVYSDEFRHSKFVAYKVKDAIVDYFRDNEGERPNIRITNPDVKLNIHIAGEDCTLSLDSSGESLHLRGYRTATVEAPINEVLAAGLIKMTGWDGECDFIDPFCGSGTFLIEAALIARGINPGVFRKQFGFEKWKDFDADLLQSIYDDDSAEREFSHHIYGYDLNLPAVEIALGNVRSARVGDIVSVEQRDVRKFVQPSAKAIIVTNPPYGERLTPPDLLATYQALGKVLKNEFQEGEAWIISSKNELFENLGLRASLKTQIFNGKLDCDFRKYQLFKGKLSDFRQKGGQVKTDEEKRLMSDHHRFRHDREDFKKRITEDTTRPEYEEFGEDEEMRQRYHILRGRHRMFEDQRNAAERRNNREQTPSRRFDDRKSRYDERKGRDDKRKGGFVHKTFRKDGAKGKPFRKGSK